MAEKSMGIFDHANQIYSVQNPNYFNTLTEAEKKSYNVYMINRILSMNPHQLEIVNELQKYNLPPEMHYMFYIKLLPKKKQYNKYIKSEKSAKYEDWMVELVAKHFYLSQDEALDYIDIYYSQNKGALRELCRSYGVDDKTIKKAKL